MAEIARIAALQDLEEQVGALGRLIDRILSVEVDRIAGLGDDEQQASAAADLIRALTSARKEVGKLRMGAVQRLKGRLSHGEIAALIGTSRSTAQQIADGRNAGTRRRISAD